MDLDDLHACVPAAQEEDLLEELALERVAAERAAHDAESGRVGDLLLGAFQEPGEPGLPGDEPPGTDAGRDASEEPSLRAGQVLGLVEHVLGARVIAVHSRSA